MTFVVLYINTSEILEAIFEILNIRNSNIRNYIYMLNPPTA
jgi:hypothetical protein